MKTWSKAFTITIIALSAWAAKASVVLARAGGGRGGSLGGSAGSFSGNAGKAIGGSVSGSSGGFGGFHFFPFFFWGSGPNMGGGSILGGFFSLALLLIVAFVIIKIIRNVNHKKRGNQAQGIGNNGAVDLNGAPITDEENDRRFAKAITFTKENMHYYAESFPRWDRDFLAGRVKQTFFWFQDAWSRQDLSEGNQYISETLLKKYIADLENMKNRGERNMIKEPILNSNDIEFIHSHMGEDDQHFIVMLSPSLIDYTLDSQERQIGGDRDHRLYFTEFWEFSWQNDLWLLTKIYQEDALELARIARGNEN